MNTTNEIIELSKKLIFCKSTSGNNKELGKALKIVKKELQEYTLEIFDKNHSKSLLFYNSKKRPNNFKLILNGHLDVIPGDREKYIPKISNEKLYGVGVMDMKASVACLVLAFKNIAKKVNYPLALQLVTDEEAGGDNGTKYQIEQGIRTDFVISGETTNFKIVNKAKGLLWLKITTRGTSSHSAYPWKGDNAILSMNRFLTSLYEKYPVPAEEVWKTTVATSNIETNNNTFNKIPDICTVTLDIRYIPGEKGAVINNIKKLLPQGHKFEVVSHQSPISVSKNNSYIKRLKSISRKVLLAEVSLHGAHGTSDVVHYSDVGMVGVEFGPVGTNGNIDDEHVEIPSLIKYYEILVDFLLSLDSIKK